MLTRRTFAVVFGAGLLLRPAVAVADSDREGPYSLFDGALMSRDKPRARKSAQLDAYASGKRVMPEACFQHDAKACKP